MKASILGRVRNTNLANGNATLPLFEAIMNSFQSIEECLLHNDHKIEITLLRGPELFNDKSNFKNPPPIETFIIKDTGSGFTEKNYESFNTVDSTHKINRGGKGIGRFLWLKAFDEIHIESHYQTEENEGFKKRTFTFSIQKNDQECTIEPSSENKFETNITLKGFEKQYKDNFPKNLETIAQKIVIHFLPIFIDPNGAQITLIDNSEKLELREFFNEHFKEFSSTHEFEIKNKIFKLTSHELRSLEI